MNAWLESVAGVRWADPVFLWLALLVPAAFLWRRRGPRASAALPALGVVDALPATARTRLHSVPTLMHGAALLVVVLALARPVERVPVEADVPGIDIVLCLDTSSSMAARDLDPARSRLDVARVAAARFIAARPDDRIGLLAFARYPDLRCPPTLDHDALLAILADTELVRPDGPEDATGIGTALASACATLDEGEHGAVVILLTDGEENVATQQTPDEIAPLHAAQLAQQTGVRVYFVIVGTDAPPDRTALTALEHAVERTGGRSHGARDAATLDAIYASIDVLETSPRAPPRFRDRDVFAPWVLLALALLLLGRALRAGPLEVLP